MQFALSARSIFRELSANDETFRLFCSVAAKGENQGGWENDRIAAKTLDAELAAKIARHGADEHKHGRLFAGLLPPMPARRCDGSKAMSMMRISSARRSR